jgi:biopolymer transport protein ExbD
MHHPDLYPGGPKKARVEIIPLIDVIFFLLATFVLFTLSLDQIRAIPVTLPVGPPPPVMDDTMAYIQASDAGVFWKVGREARAEAITWGELRPRLEAYKRSVTTARVLVRGDLRASFGATVALLDVVREAGIPEVSVEMVATPTGD